MKQWIAVAALMAVPALAQAPAAANVTGTWTTTGEVSGVDVKESCTFTQDADAKLIGDCLVNGEKFPTTGSVHDQTATWQHGGKYNGSDYIITYTGKLGSDGAITGTMSVDPFNVDGSFTAKKAAQ